MFRRGLRLTSGEGVDPFCPAVQYYKISADQGSLDGLLTRRQSAQPEIDRTADE
jgi:hypothetical protein